MESKMKQPAELERTVRTVTPGARLAAVADNRAAWNASFEPVLAGLRRMLLARRPQELARLAGVNWDAAVSEFEVTWLLTDYRITWPDLVVHTGAGSHVCPASVQGLFLYYLSLADGTPPADSWLSFRELPDGWLYHLAFHSYTGAVLVRTLAGDTAALARGAARVGGRAIVVGDCSYEFQVLPKVKLAIVYWRGDEEFPPDAQVLFDAAASHYLPVDGLAYVAGNLVQQVVKECAE
jgi:hypothetical protein